MSSSRVLKFPDRSLGVTEGKRHIVRGPYAIDIIPDAKTGRVLYSVSNRETCEIVSLGEAATSEKALVEADWTIAQMPQPITKAESAS